MERDEKRELRRFRIKVGFIFILLAVSFIALIGRTFYLQVVRGGELREIADKNQIAIEDIPADRGLILDANGELFATTIIAPSIYALPNDIPDKEYTAKQLSLALDMDEGYLLGRLNSGYRFVWLARKIEPGLEQRVKELDLLGIVVSAEQARRYPLGSLACHILGFVDVDGRAVGGVEHSLDEYLRGYPGFRLSVHDAWGRSVTSADDNFIAPRDGCTVTLTIDQWCQRVVESELSLAVERYGAKGGTVIVMEVESGRILAMASLPNFNPNEYKTSDPTSWKNPAVNLVYEPGSTIKPLIVAAALEQAKIGVYTLINCEGPLQVGEASITDVLVHEPTLSISQVLTKSSNVGIARIAMDLGGGVILRYMELMGAGKKTGIELPYESAGIIHSQWMKTKDGAAFTSFGQGLALTPLQLACAINTIANGGTWVQPTIIDSIFDGEGYLDLPEREEVSVFSSKVAGQVALLMELVVTDGGGKLAMVSGYRVAGKTGTSQKTKEDGDGYEKGSFIASFVGFAPVEDPKVLVLVMIDEPTNHLYGGTVAAPTFSRIMGGILQYLGISPSITKPLTPPDPRWGWEQEAMDDLSQMDLVQLIRWAKHSGIALRLEGEGSQVAGFELPSGEKYTLQDYITVNLTEGNVTMPRLRGLSVGEAYEILVNLGLEVRVEGCGPVVVGQYPSPGGKIEPEVVLSLGWGDTVLGGDEQGSGIL